MVCRDSETRIGSGTVVEGMRFDASMLVAEGELLRKSRMEQSIAARRQSSVAPSVRTSQLSPPEGVETDCEENWWRRGLTSSSGAAFLEKIHDCAWSPLRRP